MALSLNDIIMQQVTAAVGNANIPSNVKNQALSGLAESVLGGLTQTAAKQGGADILKAVLGGGSKSGAADLSAVAGQIFAQGAGKGLDAATSKALSGALPQIIGGLAGGLRDMDGDGDVDINDVIIALTKGGAATAQPIKKNNAAGKAILGAAAKAVLNGMLKK